MKILVVSSIDSTALARLRLEHDVICAIDVPDDALRTLIHDREVLIFRSGVTVSAEVMQCAPDLKLLIRAGSGLDNLDVDYVRQRELELMRIPEPSARAVAELAFGLMLALARNIVHADRLWRDGHWAKHELSSYLLRDKVLGIVGLGNIGREVARMGVAWGMEVVGCVGRPNAELAARLSGQGIRLASFDEVVASADFLSLHVPLDESTRHLVDAGVLARMKAGAYLVNLARGGVVDERALRDALVPRGHLRGAALDVHAAEGEGRVSPLADLPNVVLTPHIGATTVDTKREIGERVLAAIAAYGERTTSHQAPAAQALA
jgi:phosphoglycerate dehydrogenase-like enzyme